MEQISTHTKGNTKRNTRVKKKFIKCDTYNTYFGQKHTRLEIRNEEKKRKKKNRCTISTSHIKKNVPFSSQKKKGVICFYSSETCIRYACNLPMRRDPSSFY